MSYQALARKWRPHDFSQMVGQRHVVRALINGLDNDKLHHAFLFTGTRGVGKTTIARILAKCLNCEEGVSSTPCGVCTTCRELDEGRYVDLIEVDAASRARVDETRELMDNVQFLPTQGRYKVYLIDEVHMFSGHSFNALLKTLEEPPPHVKFLLATTDPRKLPITVLSRCLQFNLKRLPVGEIAGQLAYILKEEGIPAEEGITRLVAMAADGSMRDALSLLDQTVSYCGDKLGIADVRTMLGTVDREHIYRILQALARGDGNALLAQAAVMAEEITDFDGALCELLSVLQRIATVQAVPGSVSDSDTDTEDLQQLAGQMLPEDVQLYYQIALMGRRDLPFSPDSKSGFEMILLRMLAFRPVSFAGNDQMAQPAGQVPGTASAPARATEQKAAPVPARAPTAAPAPASRARPEPVPASPASGYAPATGYAPGRDAPRAGALAAGVLAAEPGNWPRIVSGLGLTGMTQEVASHCALLGKKQGTIRLCLAPAHARLASDNIKARLEEALRSYWGEEIRLLIEETVPEGETPAAIRQRRDHERQRAATQAMEADPNVRALRETFDARIENVTLDT
uniref:DNA polymerase III subunit gamma/tau n=1 Tax=Candidatus Kentrum sp. DK TaxID=2126562 RepID=A0A450SAG7_9GAMM|nr:MAG: DNA polymerase-3 subunit gamma/tau [Candidatus Kentron sp. DK]